MDIIAKPRTFPNKAQGGACFEYNNPQIFNWGFRRKQPKPDGHNGSKNSENQKKAQCYWS